MTPLIPNLRMLDPDIRVEVRCATFAKLAARGQESVIEEVLVDLRDFEHPRRRDADPVLDHQIA